MIVHYNLLKLTRNADVTEIYFRCRKVCAELELALPFLHNAEVYRCETARDSNADIMMAVHLDGIFERLSPSPQVSGAGGRYQGLCDGLHGLRRKRSLLKQHNGKKIPGCDPGTFLSVQLWPSAVSTVEV